MKRRLLAIGICLFALGAFTGAAVAPADTYALLAASGSSTVGNPDGVKKGSGDRKILTQKRIERKAPIA